MFLVEFNEAANAGYDSYKIIFKSEGAARKKFEDFVNEAITRESEDNDLSEDEVRSDLCDTGDPNALDSVCSEEGEWAVYLYEVEDGLD